MKIAYLARKPIPSVHAHAVQIVKMCEAFAKLGHEVELFIVQEDCDPATAYAKYGVEKCFGLMVYPGKLERFKKPRFVAWLFRNRFFRQADLYYGRDITSLAAASLLGKPVVYEAHSVPRAGSVRWRLMWWLFGRSNFSHLVCITSTLKESYRELFPSLGKKRIVVAPSAAAEQMTPAEHVCWPGRQGAPQIGFAGRPYPGKGIEMIIYAAHELPDLDFHVVGASKDDLHWIDVEVPLNVHFHGYQPHSKLPGYFKRFDIAVAPYGTKVLNSSRKESSATTSPLKLVEYMAAGLPTIVSDLPGIRDMIAECGESACLLIPPGDRQAFVAALARLAGDAEFRGRMGKAARAQYLERHTMAGRAKLVLSPLQNINAERDYQSQS